MRKSTQFVKESPRRKAIKQATSIPETADDYLAEGVDFEEAGEKWRAGDAVKSARFFLRAIDVYDKALKKFPKSFDLAYNKARVQYDLTQYPKLAAQLPGSLLDLLNTALESSRYALDLRQDNADVLFNTAQVLTSVAESITEDTSESVSKKEGLRFLEEAIELFQRCLALQEYQYAESQAQGEAAAPVPEPSDALLSDPRYYEDDNFPSSPLKETWATIVEQVTNDTLLDTVLAQLETLATLCGLINADEGRGLAWIEEYSTGLLNDKLPAYIHDTDRKEEAALTRASFIVALADANFRSQRLDAATYQRALEDAFTPLDLSHDPEGLCEKAGALIAYSSALNLNVREASQAQSAASSQWKALTAALDALTAASKQPSANNLAKIHLMRGDVELLRYQLGNAPVMLETAVKYAATLLKNARTYYRGAEGCGIAEKSEDEVEEAVVKEALAASLGGDGGKLMELVETEPEVSHRILEVAVDDGLVGIEWLITEGIIRG